MPTFRVRFDGDAMPFGTFHVAVFHNLIDVGRLGLILFETQLALAQSNGVCMFVVVVKIGPQCLLRNLHGRLVQVVLRLFVALAVEGDGLGDVVHHFRVIVVGALNDGDACGRAGFCGMMRMAQFQRPTSLASMSNW